MRNLFAERSRAGRRRWIVLALLYQSADALMLRHPGFHPSLLFPGLQWNWTGKLLSIALAAVVIGSSPWLRRNAGLQLRQAKGSIKWSAGCFAMSVIWGGYLSRGAPLPFDAETILYQLLMPAIAEELSDRGITLALLERGFGGNPMSGRWQFSAAVWGSSILFGIGHLQFSHAWPTNLRAFLLAGSFGLAVALVRVRSRSLLWPMLCHSAINVSVYAFAMAR